MQVLPSNHVAIGYGSVPRMKEFDDNGNVVLSVAWGEAQSVQSYRTYKAPWVGKPASKPEVAACKRGSATEVYMSWNGATEVRSWDVWGGDSNGTMRVVETTEKKGFETKAVVGTALKFVKAEAHSEGIDTGVSQTVAVAEVC